MKVYLQKIKNKQTLKNRSKIEFKKIKILDLTIFNKKYSIE
jgi:hypothetical protein